MITLGGRDLRVPIKLWAKDLEPSALAQLEAVAKLPFVFSHVAAMADSHFGMGATIGSVIATKGAIIPAAVGVDIGCGMCAVRLTLTANDLPDDLLPVRHQIERDIPVGHNKHKYALHADAALPELTREKDWLGFEHPTIFKVGDYGWHKQLGTLGGGNHFIELCLDEQDQVWLMLHSGSRNLGKVIADYFITKAKIAMEQWLIPLPNKDLAYLPDGTQDYVDYVRAVMFAQNYASWNRKLMVELVLGGLQKSAEHIGLPPFQATDLAVNCHHNYVAHEHHFGQNVIVTRKGAIRARFGDLGIIPGSMGTKSYIVTGKENADSFHSSSHGAGRRMSRTAARAKFTLTDLAQQTGGVECRKDAGILDEIPGAYKDIDEVMEAQSDLVDVVHTLKAVLCVKG